MKILITGASSFSGAFFVKQLALSGHEVVATYRLQPKSYTGVRLKRVQLASQYARNVYGVSFGDDRFIDLISNESFDVYGHHGAWTQNYRSMNYDIHSAFLNNTKNVQHVLQNLASRGCHRVVISASIFEGNGVLYERDKIPFSPHGLIKLFTSKTIDFYGCHYGMHVSRFVIPNPFGVLDNPKLIDYLCGEWFARRIAQIKTPLYIRDNIHVELLAQAYVYWLEQMVCTPGSSVFAPSGYVGSMGDFVGRIAKEMRIRLGWPCAYHLEKQTDFSQPKTLVNSTPVLPLFEHWDPATAWEALAAYQRKKNKV